MRASLPRYSLNALFLAVTILCVWIVQSSLADKEERFFAEWERLIHREATLLNLQEADAQFEKASSVGRINKALGAVNLVIVVAAIYFYKRHKQRAIWLASFVAILATAIAAMISSTIK
jgi:hypothetical protein